MVWLFIAFHCIVSNTSCCIFHEFLHNRYSSSSNTPTKVKMWNFHLWNYRLPGVFPRVSLVHNKGEFSWLANFATSLMSACAECTTPLGRNKEENNTVSTHQIIFVSRIWRKITLCELFLLSLIGSSDCESAIGGASCHLGLDLLHSDDTDATVMCTEEGRKRCCFNKYSRTPWDISCWCFWPVKPQPLWS